MLARLLAALAVVGCLTAFAPAPFPRTERKVKEGDDLSLLQGTWKVVSYDRPGLKVKGGGVVKFRSVITNVRIEKNQWSFMRELNGQLSPTVTYEMKIDPKANPRKMDLTRDLSGSKYRLRAIYKLEGSQLKVLYVSTYVPAGGGGAKAVETPISFENPPSSAIQYTLERGR